MRSVRSASGADTGRDSSAAAAFPRPLGFVRGRLMGHDVLGACGVPKGTSAPVLQRPRVLLLMLMREDDKEAAAVNK